jgi:PPM family protein phosphatase
VTTSLVVLVAVIVGGGYIAWRWSQDQYYVGADSKGEVIIYRGVNQRIAGISLSKPYQPTGIELAQVPAPYQQAVKTTDAASSLSNAQAIVANVRTQVTACQQQYTQLKDWVTQENAYQAALAQAKQAKQAKKPAPKVPPNPGPQPSKADGMCPPSTAFGIPASALAPAATGRS